MHCIIRGKNVVTLGFVVWILPSIDMAIVDNNPQETSPRKGLLPARASCRTTTVTALPHQFMLCAIMGPFRGLPTHTDLSTRRMLGRHPTITIMLTTNENPATTIGRMKARFRVLLLVYPRIPSHSSALPRLVRPLERNRIEPTQDKARLLTAVTDHPPRYPTLKPALFFERVPIPNPNLDRRHDRPGVLDPVSPNSMKSLLFFPSHRSNQCRKRYLRAPRMRCRYQEITILHHQKVLKPWEWVCMFPPASSCLATRPCT